MVTALDRSGYELEFEDTFRASDLDTTKWLPYYLPQWASREHTRARYETGEGLTLLIDEDQLPWAPQYDGPLRVTNLQTGVRSGPLGSYDGQLRFRPEVTVSEEQEAVQLYTPTYGIVEARLRAHPDPNCMVALYLIGFEERPHESGEICIVEIFGDDLGRSTVGIHRWHDPALLEDVEKAPIPGDSTQFHEYAARWEPGRTEFFTDGELVKSIDQAPDYPMQLMLDIYEFEPGGEYPKRFQVDWVRGWRRADAG
jgi:hypothetical protein